jgi:hypothetical protein
VLRILPVSNPRFFRLQLSDVVHCDLHAMERPRVRQTHFGSVTSLVTPSAMFEIIEQAK